MMEDKKEGKAKVSDEGVSFLKTKKVEEQTPAEKEEARTNLRPVFDEALGVYFVNGGKYRWARNTLALIKGELIVREQRELERKEHYSAQLAKHGVSPDAKEAIAVLYEIRGGLMRNPAQQKAADDRKVEAQKKGKKRQIEL